MKPRKVIIQIEMLTDIKVKDLKKYFLGDCEGYYNGTDIEVRVNVIRDTKKRK